MLREYGDQLEADFAHYYGLDLLGLYRGELSPRKVAALALNLPAGAVTRAQIDPDAAWSATGHLLAHAVDALRVANWQRSADGAKGRNRPRPVPRPGDVMQEEHRGDRALDQARQFLARQAGKSPDE